MWNEWNYRQESESYKKNNNARHTDAMEWRRRGDGETAMNTNREKRPQHKKSFVT